MSRIPNISKDVLIYFSPQKAPPAARIDIAGAGHGDFDSPVSPFHSTKAAAKKQVFFVTLLRQTWQERPARRFFPGFAVKRAVLRYER